MNWFDEIEAIPPSCDELISWLMSTKWNRNGIIFRGISNYEFKPRSKLERVLINTGIPRDTWKDRENKAVGFFKDKARLLINSLPDDQDLLHWFSFMQHYGAPTRLTDWSVSPLVACFFAYEGTLSSAINEKKEEYAALWMLNANLLRRVFPSKFLFGRDHLGVVPSSIANKFDGHDDLKFGIDDVIYEQNYLLRQAIEKEINWPIPLPILKADARMSAQQACFVFSGRLTDENEDTALDQLLKLKEGWYNLLEKELAKFKPQPGSLITSSDIFIDENSNFVSYLEKREYVIKKIRLPWEWRENILSILARANINANTLFPTLDGLGKATEIYIHTGQPATLHSDFGL